MGSEVKGQFSIGLSSDTSRFDEAPFLGEFELLDVPSSKTEKKLHKIKLPLLKQSKPSSRAKSHPAVNKKGIIMYTCGLLITSVI